MPVLQERRLYRAEECCRRCRFYPLVHDRDRKRRPERLAYAFRLMVRIKPLRNGLPFP